MLVRAGIVTITVSNITLTVFFFFIKSNLKIREMRIALMKVVDAPNSKLRTNERTVDNIVIKTIKKSKILP